MHGERVDAHGRQFHQPTMNGGQIVDVEPQAIHSRVEFDVHANRWTGRREFEQPDLFDVVERHREAERTTLRHVTRLEHAFQQQDRPLPPGRPRAPRLVEVEHRQSIGLRKSFYRALDPVAVGIGLDHRPHRTTVRPRARRSEVVTHCGNVDAGLDRTWHERRTGKTRRP